MAKSKNKKDRTNNEPKTVTVKILEATQNMLAKSDVNL
jgi:hypothetical protein